MKHKKKITNQYCIECGKQMKREYVNMHFDPNTGDQLFNIIWRCPDKRWWNCHSRWKSDEWGNTYQFEG